MRSSLAALDPFRAVALGTGPAASHRWRGPAWGPSGRRAAALALLDAAERAALVRLWRARGALSRLASTPPVGLTVR